VTSRGMPGGLVRVKAAGTTRIADAWTDTQYQTYPAQNQRIF